MCREKPPPYFSGGDIKSGSIVIDGGSFPGDFAVLAAKLVGPKGKVIALEPNTENRKYLEKVLRANKVENIVELLPYALSDNNSGVLLTGDTIFSHSISQNQNKQNQAILVPTITIDNLLEQRNLLNASANIVVKMDIEGAELAAFDGASKTLKQGAAFIIAAYHIVNGQRTAEILVDKFKNIGYDVSLINPTHLTLMAKRSTASNL